jgi:gliding motility-associated-like protein
MKGYFSGNTRQLFTIIFFLLMFYAHADNYYWISGSGNWSDINHWATSSGGSILHNTPPSADDDVFFDSNSFILTDQIVSVNTENAVCQNLDWSAVTNNPIFINTTSVNIRIFGSLILSSNMQYEYGGTLTFESTITGNIIKTEGHTILNNIIFGGINGEWTFEDNLTVDGNIYQNYGNLFTNNMEVSCNSYSSATTNNRKLILGSSNIFLDGSWNINSTNLIFDSGTSILNIKVNISNSGNLILTYNKVVFTGGTSTLQNLDSFIYYDSIFFQLNGVMHGDCSVNSLEFTGSGSVYDSDTINYARFGYTGNLTGNHYVDTAQFNTVGYISGANYIHYSTIRNRGNIFESNQIDYIKIGDTAVIEGNNLIKHLFLNKMGYIRENNIAQYAYFNCGGSFVGNNTFDTLTFSPGFEYILELGTIQTINKQWNISGNCEGPIFIKSSYSGRAATIHSTNAIISGSHLSLRDIHASGNIPFTASQSVNLGNNNNWDIDTMAVRSLYWVNGNGNWNDSNHWAISSGGPGGHCPPTERDDVFINGNSANPEDSVKINTRNAVCFNMDWTNSGNLVFFGPDSNNLKIYGSLKFNPDLNLAVNGETHFEDTLGNKTIFSGEKVFLNHVRFQGTNGGWTLLDQFVCNDIVYHERGSVSTDGSNIICRRYSSADTNYRKLYLHSDTVKLFGSPMVWDLNGYHYDLHADSSVIITTNNNAIIKSQNAERLVYHNVHQFGTGSTVTNEAYCVYNLVTHLGASSLIEGNCTIDTSIMFASGIIYGDDTIKTAIYYGVNSLLKGASIVEIAYFFDDGTVQGSNKIDTALFYKKGKIFWNNQIDTTIIYNDATISGQNKIRTATLKDKGWFYGNNEFDDLTFTYAKKYIFEHDSIQVINNNWQASGRCTGSIFLMSDVDGLQAIIEKVNGNVDIEYANIRDIYASGVTPFIAGNSIDLGNNENWDITMGESQALYWVGGTGNWSDSLHWAPISGGQGPYCIPSPIDDVYFDENSFLLQNDTVYLDLENATCRNMIWAGSENYDPVFYGQIENDLFIYGSLLLNDSMNLAYSGITYFESTEMGRTIETKSKRFNNDAVFQGRTGGWTLADGFATAKDITLIYGSFNTKDQQIDCYSFISADSNHREILLNESELFINNSWQINAQNLLFDGDSSIINFGSLFKSFNGDTLVYNDLNAVGGPSAAISLLSNDSVYCYFNTIYFDSIAEGDIRGNCSIDTAVFDADLGVIYDTDLIDFVWFKQQGRLAGGEHFVKSAIFDGNGTISGECTVNSAIFNADGNVLGQNTLDTTIIYGNGLIQGDNVFNSFVNIYGSGYIQSNNHFKSSVIIYNQGTLSGTNTVLDNLVIYGYANIFGNNIVNDGLLLDWGDLGGANIFDTLTFTPGNTYTLVSGQTQSINHRFKIRGNNCFPIILKSSITSNQAIVNVVSDTVSGDFINMKDIQASGTAVFYAGGHSTDISNNSGWIWDNAPGYIYGLGLDHANICPGETLVLDTENFNGNPDTQYQWSDGTISPTYEVTQPGIYQVMVIYSDSCQVPGQVVVDMIPAPEIDLGEDKEICEGDSVEFISSGNYIAYLWNTGSSNPSIPATVTDLYWLEVTGENGCKNSDTVFLEVLPAPVVDLGSDQIIHNGEFVTLDAGAPADSYTWSTGDSTQFINALGVEGGNIYWVLVEYKGCSTSDTIVIDEYPSCIAELPSAFSPNGDGTNDELEVFVSGLKILDLKIFDRYGELVYESIDPQGNQKWDGKHNSEKQEMEVYTYYLKAICQDGYLIEKKGNVTLLR